jgi:hypothetical protein
MRPVHELDPSKIFISRRQFLAATSVLASAPLWSRPAFAAPDSLPERGRQPQS